MSTADQLNQTLEAYLSHAQDELPKVASAAARLDAQGRALLAGVVGRFDVRNNQSLNPKERLMIGRVLARVRKIDVETLTILNKVLDYIDLNANAQVEPAELELGIELMEGFSSIESDDETLSARELEMLYAVLRNLDSNDSGKLESSQRIKLRERLRDPRYFWETEKMNNPLLEPLLGKN